MYKTPPGGRGSIASSRSISIECLWLEINIRNRKIHVDTFYRPPNSTPQVHTDIENSIGLAVYTGMSDFVILGDFNLNILNLQ